MQNPSSLDARACALRGAFLASEALDGASMALHHKLAHVLGGSMGLPHAPTHAALLPYTLAFNGAARPHVGALLATAWRTDDPAAALYDRMRDAGLPVSLRELELPEGGKRFELATENDDDHHHLICVACGRTEEFESPEVLQAGASAAEQFGFKLLSPRLTVRGLCPSCAVLQGGEAN